MTSVELLAAAVAHRDRCAARYGPASYQAQCAERAAASISELVAPATRRSSPATSL